MRTEAEVRNGVARRLGYVPVHLRAGDQPADVLATLWEHGLAAHWDSPVPATFREELLVQLSLACPVPACAVAHCGELSQGEGVLAASASGPRKASEADGSRSLSIELVKMFTSQVDGRFEMDSDGAQLRVVFALPEQRANGGETT